MQRKEKPEVRIDVRWPSTPTISPTMLPLYSLNEHSYTINLSAVDINFHHIEMHMGQFCFAGCCRLLNCH